MGFRHFETISTNAEVSKNGRIINNITLKLPEKEIMVDISNSIKNDILGNIQSDSLFIQNLNFFDDPEISRIYVYVLVSDKQFALKSNFVINLIYMLDVDLDKTIDKIEELEKQEPGLFNFIEEEISYNPQVLFDKNHFNEHQKSLILKRISLEKSLKPRLVSIIDNNKPNLKKGDINPEIEDNEPELLGLIEKDITMVNDYIKENRDLLSHEIQMPFELFYEFCNNF